MWRKEKAHIDRVAISKNNMKKVIFDQEGKIIFNPKNKKNKKGCV